MKNALIFGSRSFLISSSGYWNLCSCLRVHLDELEVVVLEVRHLEVGGEDRHAQGDRVALVEDAVALQRLEDVAHGGRATLDRVDLELAFGRRGSAHRPLQVLVHDLLVVHQHPVRHRVMVADDRIHQFVHELVGVEGELLHRPRHHSLQERRAGHVVVLRQPGVEPAGNARGLGHAAHARRQVQHALALGDRELPEQKERLSRLGGHPVGVAATGVQVGARRFLRGLRRHLGQEVLDLEWAQFLVLF